jgi:hypothetical protein
VKPHSLRTTLLFSCLSSLLIMSGLVTMRTLVTHAHSGHDYQPAGYGMLIPQRVNTSSMPYIHLVQTASTVPDDQSPGDQPASAHAHLDKPHDVVNVPPPTSTDPTAKQALSLNQPKPDANGVGGDYNYLETVNGGLGIYNRNGAPQLSTTYQAWFKLPTAQFVDPVAMWDNSGNAFLFSILQQGTTNILLSVAQQPNGTGSWCNYTISGLAGHDFDKLGVNSNGIYVSANILSKTGQVVNNELFSANRIALESCQMTKFTRWTDLTNQDGSIAEAITPAREDSNASGIEYLVNSIPTGGCQLTLWSLTASGNLSKASVATQCYSPPPQAKQLGSKTLIGTGDSSITQADYVNGLLTVDNIGSYDWGDGNGLVGIVEWYVLNASSATVANQGSFGTPGYWLFYPSTVTTANGNMLFVYNASGPTIYPSVWYVDQSMSDTQALANGTGPYGTGTVAPWGDYQSAWPDTNMRGANSVWITGEYGESTNVWGTSFDLVTP